MTWFLKLMVNNLRLLPFLPRRSDPETYIVSLGLEDAYVELELEEAIAYAQQREQYVRV